jgi:hypothetical protein
MDGLTPAAVGMMAAVHQWFQVMVTEFRNSMFERLTRRAAHMDTASKLSLL